MIVFLDLDDTLWRWHQVCSSAKESIIQAHRNGHKIFINTGRTKCEVPLKPLEGLPIDGYCFSAGSEILIENKQVLYKPLRPQIVKALIERIEPMNLAMSLEGSQKTFQNEVNYEIFKKFAKDDRTGAGMMVHHHLSEITEEDYHQIMKVSIHYPEGSDISNLIENLPEGLVFTPFKNTGGEITNCTYNKATAIQFVKSYYQSDEKTMAVGDSENDITMLKEADISIAMGNGNDHVKKISNYITTNIDENGLKNAFKHFGLID